jgi:hypothetical protein
MHVKENCYASFSVTIECSAVCAQIPHVTENLLKEKCIPC